MSYFDLAILIIVGAFALFGLWFGIVHTLGSLLGTVLGIYLAGLWYAPGGIWLMQLTGWTGNFSKILMFVLAFILINRLVGLGFFVLEKVLSLVTHLPIINGLNRMLGFLFGLAEGTIVVGVVLYLITKFPLSTNFMTAFGASRLAPYCIKVITFLLPLLPQALKTIKGISLPAPF